MGNSPRMKVVFISGPYRDPRGEYHVRRNIRHAEDEALFVWANGGVALAPHKNTAGLGGALGQSEEIWLAGDLELLYRCDAVYLIHGWERSCGALTEFEAAREVGLPILASRDEVLHFLST